MVILGAGESGAGAAVLAKAKGFDVFVSDKSSIKPKYKEMLDNHGIRWEEGSRHLECRRNCQEPGYSRQGSYHTVIEEARYADHLRDRVCRKVYGLEDDLHHG